MIDLHCHLLPGVDDGSRNIQETLLLLKSAKQAGFDTICFTPHYAYPNYINSKLQNQLVLNQVKIEADKENIDIDLLLGNEVFIQEKILELLESAKISSLAGSDYILVELPMYQELDPEVVKKMLKPLLDKNKKIVIAHPERYSYIQENPNKIVEYSGDNIFFQGNYASIIGTYGKQAQKTIKKLLKNRQIHYLSSDVHHIKRCFYDDFDKIKKKLLKVVDKSYFEELTESTPRTIIENKEIERES